LPVQHTAFFQFLQRSSNLLREGISRNWSLRDRILLNYTRIEKSTGKEEGALIKHYTMKHPAISDNLPLLANCYKVTFVEQPPCENLGCCEDKWMHRIKASINLDRMILPDIR